MKPIFKLLLKYYLKIITKIVLFIYRPTIIAVAGSTNKPFVKKEIKKILIEMGNSVRANPKNFNTEIGLPLSVLYLPSGFNSYKNWIRTIILAPLEIFKTNFPKYLVLSLGSSDPGDMEYLLSIVKPKIAVLTNITQRHLEGFDGIDELFDEYIYLINTLGPTDVLIINKDITRFDSLVRNCKAKIITYGIDAQADYQAVGISKNEHGQIVKVMENGICKDHDLNKQGQHHVYVLLVGLIIKDYASR